MFGQVIGERGDRAGSRFGNVGSMAPRGTSDQALVFLAPAWSPRSISKQASISKQYDSFCRVNAMRGRRPQTGPSPIGTRWEPRR